MQTIYFLKAYCLVMTMTKTKTNTTTKTHRHKQRQMCFQDPMYALYLKSMGFKDIKYGISSKISHRKFSTKNFPPKTFHNNFIPNISHQKNPQKFATKQSKSSSCLFQLRAAFLNEPLPKQCQLLQSLLGKLNPSQQGPPHLLSTGQSVEVWRGSSAV